MYLVGYLIYKINSSNYFLFLYLLCSTLALQVTAMAKQTSSALKLKEDPR